MGYVTTAIRGISWTAGFRGLTRVIAVLRIVIVARFFLNPYQIGLFGIATLVLSLLEILTETGINVFLVQSQEEMDKYINSAWIISILRGFIIGLAIFLLSGIVANFFNAKEATYLLALIALVPIIKGFINPSIAKLQKELLFKKEFYLRSSLLLFETFITLLCAYLLRNPICFIYGFIVSAIGEVILSNIFFSPIPRFEIEVSKIKHIFNKGKWVMMYGIFNYFAQEGDTMVVGKMLGASSLALYQTGYKISTLPVSEIADVVSKVVFPVYTKITDDRKRLLRAFLQTTLAIAFASICLGVIIILFPYQIVGFFLGEKWIGVAPILGVLTVYGMLRSIFGSASAMFLATGRQNYVAMMTFIRFIILAITIIPLTAKFGLVGAGYSALLSVIFEIPLILYLSRKIFI